MCQKRTNTVALPRPELYVAEAACHLAGIAYESLVPRGEEEQPPGCAQPLRGSPYAKYFLVVHVDEPGLQKDEVAGYLTEFAVPDSALVDEVIVLLSYDPAVKACPGFKMDLRSRRLDKLWARCFAFGSYRVLQALSCSLECPVR